MRNRKYFIGSTIVAVVLAAAFSPSVHAQNFAEIKPKENNESDAKLKFVNPSQPAEVVGTDSIQEVMKPEEYQQYMAAKAYADQTSKYTLGATDEIEVTVLRHPEVSNKYLINSEGKIQYEFVGDVLLAGLTKEQAAEMLAKSLSTYIVNPQVTVKIFAYNSKIVYVVGEVGAPGKIFMRGDTITIREALLLANLPLLSGKISQALMFTPSASGKVERRVVDVNALLYKGDLRQDYVMKPGDTLYIPATFWAKALRVITPVTQPVGQVAGAAAL